MKHLKNHRSGQGLFSVIMTLGVLAALSAALVARQRLASKTVVSASVEALTHRSLENIASRLGADLAKNPSTLTGLYGCAGNPTALRLSVLPGYSAETNTYLSCYSLSAGAVLTLDRKPSAQLPPVSSVSMQIQLGCGPRADGPSGTGTGTSADPYQIFTAEQLDCIRDFYPSSDFVVKNNIDLSTLPVASGTNFHPITIPSPLSIFEGGGFSIQNLKFSGDPDPASSTSSPAKVGLFYQHAGTIKNLSLTNVNLAIASNKNGTSSPESWTIGSVAASAGTLQNIDVSGTFSFTSSLLSTQGLVADIGGIAGIASSCVQCVSRFSPVINIADLQTPSAASTATIRYGGLMGSAMNGTISRSAVFGPLALSVGGRNTGGLSTFRFLGGGLIGTGTNVQILNSAVYSDFLFTTTAGKATATFNIDIHRGGVAYSLSGVSKVEKSIVHSYARLTKNGPGDLTLTGWTASGWSDFYLNGGVFTVNAGLGGGITEMAPVGIFSTTGNSFFWPSCYGLLADNRNTAACLDSTKIGSTVSYPGLDFGSNWQMTNQHCAPASGNCPVPR